MNRPGIASSNGDRGAGFGVSWPTAVDVEVFADNEQVVDGTCAGEDENVRSIVISLQGTSIGSIAE